MPQTVVNTDQDDIERFDVTARTWDDNPMHTTLAQAVYEAIAHKVPLLGTQRSLDLGCGTGILTTLIAPYLGKVLAIDSSQAMLDVAKRKLLKLGLSNVTCERRDFSTSLPEGPFDFVFSSMALHHVADVSQLLVRLHRIMAPGGRFAFADLADINEPAGAKQASRPTLRGFEQDELFEWLILAGFRSIGIRCVCHFKKSMPDGSTRDYPVLLATGHA